MNKVVQTRLRITHGNGVYTEQIVWLPVDKRVKPGKIITLKDDPLKTKWTVHEQMQILEVHEIKRGWNNNI
jgi:hypothetical protein